MNTAGKRVLLLQFSKDLDNEFTTYCADFIDLVKNPVEFEKKLKILKDEQDRLNTAIETIEKLLN